MGMAKQVIVFWELCSKNACLQGSTFSGPRMTMGFSPFELPTRGLLQKGRITPCLRFALRSPAFVWLVLWAFTVLKLLNKLGVVELS